jgi:beta-lactamase class A
MTDPFAELRSLTGRLAVAARYLDDFSPCAPEWRADQDMPAASVIKVGIMAHLLQQASQQALRLDDRLPLTVEQMTGGAGVLWELEPRDYSLAELCKMMMVVSDNSASNALARLLGLPAMNEFWARRGYQACMRRFFMQPVVEGQDNSMSAAAAAAMLRDLYLGSELEPAQREFALECLRRQQYREKIPLMLPPEVVVGHKTGELDGVRHDAAVIEAERPYILVVLTAEGKEPWLVDQAIGRLSLQLFQEVTA